MVFSASIRLWVEEEVILEVIFSNVGGSCRYCSTMGYRNVISCGTFGVGSMSVFFSIHSSIMFEDVLRHADEI